MIPDDPAALTEDLPLRRRRSVPAALGRMLTWLSTYWIILFALALVAAGCLILRSFHQPVAVDRHDPEAVLRAYFDAWVRGDWASQASFMDAKYGQMVPEPMESIQIQELQPVTGPSSTGRSFYVRFVVQVKGSGVSMRDGTYDWTYTLSWDAGRDSWLITNYGAG